MNVKLILMLELFLTVVLAVLLILYAHKRRNVPAANHFIVLMVLAILYSLTYLGEINASTLKEALIWFDIEHIPIPLLLYTWFIMGLDYVRLPKKYSDVLKIAALYHPVSFLALFFTNPLHHQYVSSFRFESNGYFPVLFYTRGPIYAYIVASGTFLGLFCTALYIWGFLKAPRLQRGGYLIMIIASLFPWAGVYFTASAVSPLQIDSFPILSMLSGVLYMFGIFRFRIFKTFPIATETVFRQAKEGILLIDWSDLVIDVNDAFLKLYPELKKPNKKLTFTAFTKSHGEFRGLLEGTGSVGFKRMEDGKVRHYSAELDKIHTSDSRLEVGKILTLTDITLYAEYQKKLEDIAQDALNRAETTEISFLQAQIKPHFLNNTLSVIASMITRDPQEAKNLITELGDYLAGCYYFDETSPFVPLREELDTVQTYVRIEKARFRERLIFTLDCADIPQLDIPRLILQPLVENAIRHGILKKAGGGSVRLRISYYGENVLFEVTDDGVGIAPYTVERLLHDTQGALNGIGIVNINRRLLKYYGSGLDIISAPEQGTTVSFCIPQRADTLRASKDTIANH